MGEYRRVEVGAVGDDHAWQQPPTLEVAEKTTPVVLVITADQGKADGQVTQRVGGQKQRETSQVQFIDAQRAGELGHDHLTVCRQVELGDLPTQAVVDEAFGQLQEEVAFHGGEGALDVESVVEDAVQDGLANLFVVVGFGRDVQGPGAEELAAGTACLIFGIVDFEVGHLAIGQGADTTT